MSWTAERTDLMRKLWAEGCSAGVIAKRLGGTTRNAIIGKVSRLGLTRHPQPLGTKRIPRVTNPLGNKAGRLHRGSAGGLASKVLYATKPPKKLKVRPVDLGPLEALMITTLQLTSHNCKWPLGAATGAQQLYCGAAKVIEVSYCRHHMRIAYRPLAPRSVRDAARQMARLAA